MALKSTLRFLDDADVLSSRLSGYREAVKDGISSLRRESLSVHVPPGVGLYTRFPGAHFHAAPELFFQLGGATDFECPGGSFRLKAGQVCIMPRGLPHRETRLNACSPFRVLVFGHVSYGFTIHQTRLDARGIPLSRRSSDQFQSPRGRNAFRYLDEIASFSLEFPARERCHFSLSGLELFFMTILHEIEGRRKESADSVDSSLITEAEKFLRWKLSEPSLSVTSIASELGVSADHLSREFRRHRGVSFKTWIISERLSLARNLLADHRNNVSEIGYLCGFNSPAYFGCIFRRRTGLTPRAYRLSCFRK